MLAQVEGSGTADETVPSTRSMKSSFVVPVSVTEETGEVEMKPRKPVPEPGDVWVWPMLPSTLRLSVSCPRFV